MISRCTFKGCFLSDDFSFGSSLSSFFIRSSVINCISSSVHLDSVNSTPMSCCFRGFFLGDMSTVGFMVILDCSGSSSSPGDDVADTVVDPELWHPPPSWSPRGEQGGLDVVTGGKDARTGTRFFAAPKRTDLITPFLIDNHNKSEARFRTFNRRIVVIPFSKYARSGRRV